MDWSSGPVRWWSLVTRAEERLASPPADEDRYWEGPKSSRVLCCISGSCVRVYWERTRES